MLSLREIADWLEIQDGLARAAEHKWQADVVQQFEQRRQEIYKEMGGLDVLQPLDLKQS